MVVVILYNSPPPEPIDCGKYLNPQEKRRWHRFRFRLLQSSGPAVSLDQHEVFEMNVAALRNLLAVTALACGAFAAPAAMAGQTWNLGDTASTLAGDGIATSNGCMRSAGGGWGNSVNCNAGAANTPITAAATGWVTTDTSAGSTFTTGYLSNQGNNGIGLQDHSESTGSPYHTIDSINNSELIAIQFSKAVSLQSVTIGWSSGDTDFSVLAWTGTGAPTMTSLINGKTVNGTTGLLAAGWTLVGQYGDNGGTSPDLSGNTGNDADRTTSVNRGSVAGGDISTSVFSSSYWLIAAFNSSYASGGSGGLGRDAVADAWKLLSVAGNAATSTVPEPGSLALVGLALLGAVGARRSKATAA